MARAIKAMSWSLTTNRPKRNLYPQRVAVFHKLEVVEQGLYGHLGGGHIGHVAPVGHKATAHVEGIRLAGQHHADGHKALTALGPAHADSG
jgi:hypothetical protein